VASPDGDPVVRAARSGRQEDAVSLGEDLAEEILSLGAAEILERLREEEA
jgi:porphobilinogen deaminase